MIGNSKDEEMAHFAAKVFALTRYKNCECWFVQIQTIEQKRYMSPNPNELLVYEEELGFRRYITVRSNFSLDELSHFEAYHTAIALNKQLPESDRLTPPDET